MNGRWPAGTGSPRRRCPNASRVIVTVASTPSVGRVLSTRSPRPLPTLMYHVSGGSPAISWATVKEWLRDQAAWMT